MPTARSIGVGAFVLGGLLLFAIALFMIGERRNVFSHRFIVYTQMKTITGVQLGATVRVAGMNAGEVKDIEVPTRPSGSFRIRMEVREDLHPLVRTDSIASIRTEGLVGAQYLQITAGSENQPKVTSGGTIPSQEPFEISDLLQQAAATIATVNQTIMSVRGEVETAITTIQQTASDADNLIRDVGGDIIRIAKAGARIADDTGEIIAGVREGRGTVGQLFANDDLYRKAQTIAGQVQDTIASLRQAVDQAKQAFSSATGKGGPVAGFGAELKDTLTKTRQTMDSLAAATEALKHNFLLRGYFNRRGYFNLSDISPHEYRAGALETNGRRPLRVWLAADALFARQPDGSEALTDAGKTAINEALGPLLKYRGQGPLMVEGYAEQGDTAARYLLSRDRANLVRDYIVDRFQLDLASTGIMPLDGQAKGSPAGDQWDGVALAMFLPKRIVEDALKK